MKKTFINTKFYSLTVVLFTIFWLGLISCEKEDNTVQIPPHQSRLVVNCFFSPDSLWTVQVSRSLGILDKASLRAVTNANIKIYENGILVESLDSNDYNSIEELYKGKTHKPQKGKKYSIKVSAAGFNDVTAEDIAPAPVSIIELKSIRKDTSELIWDPFDSVWTGPLQGTLYIRFSDPPDENNYYRISVYSVDSYEYAPEYWEVYENNIMDFEEVNPYFDYIDDAAYFSDVAFNGQNFQIPVKFNAWDFNSKRKYYVSLRSMTKANYLYKKSIFQYYQNQGNPFAEPVQVYSNVKNGFGIFSGYSSFIGVVKL